MGKRILAQRKGSSRIHRVSSHRFPGKNRLPNVSEEVVTVTDLVHSPAHTAPLARYKTKAGDKGLMVAAEGIGIGEKLAVGSKVNLKPGNITELSNLPEGTPIHNVETRPGDGGKIARSGGNMALIETQIGDKVRIRLPSGKSKVISSRCRASIGVLAGHGRREKPMLKAGSAHYRAKARGKRYPKVSGVAMNPVSHPHGGGNHQHVGGPSSVSHGTPPGAKVGFISPRRTGRKRGKTV